MKQKLFKKSGLLLIADKGKSRLYKVSKVTGKKSFELQQLQFLSEPQQFIEVHEKANLIVTQDALYTLDEKIIYQYQKAKLSVLPVTDTDGEPRWMIVQDYIQSDDLRYRITFWDGTREFDYIFGKVMLQNDKYLAVYTSGDDRWCVYTKQGDLTMEVNHIGSEILLVGDFLVIPALGNYSVYSMLKAVNIASETHLVFNHQQLVMCSKSEEFAICANLLGVVQIYYRGERQNLGKADMIDFYDSAGLFTLKRKDKYFIYRFNGEPFAENICPCGADLVACDEDKSVLMVGNNGSFRFIKI